MSSAMRSLTSFSLTFPVLVSVSVARTVASSLSVPFLLKFVLLLPQTAHVLIKRSTASVLREHCLEFKTLLKTSLNLLVSVFQSDWGIQTFHV